jgi:large subunit ribosomal protein L23
VEEIFKVKVLAVNTCRYEGKKKRLGRTEGRRPDWKKAIVTLAPGEKIPFFEGA